MAASVRLLARFYINAPKSQASTGLLVGRCGYGKDSASLPEDEGKKPGGSTLRDGDDVAVADALKSAVQKVSSWSSDPEEAHKMMKELERRVANLAGRGSDSRASNSIAQRMLAEAARGAGSKGDLTSEAAVTGHVRRQRAAADASVAPATTVEGVPVVSRQRAIATHKAASNSSSSSSRRAVQGSGEQAVRQRLMREQQQPAMVPEGMSLAEQLVRERRSAAADRRRQPRVGAQADAGQHAAATAATAPAVDVSGPRRSQAAVSGSSRGVLASLWEERAPAATAVSETKNDRDILAAAASTGGASEQQPSQGQSVTAQMLQGRSTTRRVQGTYRSTSESIGRQQDGPAAAVGVNTVDVSKRFRDALDKTVHDTAEAQAEETKKSLSILDQLMGPRPDKLQPRSSSFGGSWKDSYKLYEGKRLNVFHPEKWSLDTQDSKWNSLWATHIDDAASFAAHLPPTNAFEEQIQLTKEGKLWTFPIDNEAGMEHEKTVPFTEHVFLEKHLSNFPKKGPVRHFMELVVNGLSKNPYITVDEKVGHIKWFEKYFADKKGLLEELGTEQQQHVRQDAAV